jgi:hypothetical protein
MSNTSQLIVAPAQPACAARCASRCGAAPAPPRPRAPRRRGAPAGLHQYRHRHHQPGLVGQRHVPRTDAQPATQALAPGRPDDLRLAPGVLHDADVADPHAVREAGAQRLDDRFLGSKAHRQEALGPARAGELRALGRQQQPLDEALAPALEGRMHAPRLQHIDADTVDHRAASIAAFMARTAAGRPSNTARATIAWPILSSTMSRIAATGATFW